MSKLYSYADLVCRNKIKRKLIKSQKNVIAIAFYLMKRIHIHAKIYWKWKRANMPLTYLEFIGSLNSPPFSFDLKLPLNLTVWVLRSQQVNEGQS